MESARCRAFIASADTGSFTAAGKKLDYTPSGVSQLVRAFENELGLTLLSRRNRGVTLTKDGERIYPKIVEYIGKEESMMKIARDISSLNTGSITVAAFSSLAARYLPQVISRFSSRFTNIELGIIEASKFRIQELINDNTADLALSSELDDPGFDFIPLLEDRIVAILPKDHKYAGAAAYPLDECAHEDMIMPAKGNDLDVLKVLKDNGISHNISLTTIEDITAAHLVSAGLGISITNESAVDPSPDGEYVIIPVEPLTAVTYGISVPSLESCSPSVRSFINYASEIMTKPEKSS